MLYFPNLLVKFPWLSAKNFSHTESNICFHNIKKFVLFKSLIEISCSDELKQRKTQQWSYNVIAPKLQCDSFKLLKQVVLLFPGKMNYHASSSNQFILSIISSIAS